MHHFVANADWHEPRHLEWLITEWPSREAEPTRFWLSTMLPDTPLEQLVRLSKLRWRIERDYQELKGSFGLDHYEGRGWRGFHHHGTHYASRHALSLPPRELSFFRAAGVLRGFKPTASASAA